MAPSGRLGNGAGGGKKQRSRSFIVWIPFYFILGLFAFGYYAMLSVSITYTLQRGPWISVLFQLAASTLLAGMSTWCLLVAVLKSPGIPPKGLYEEERGTSSGYELRGAGATDGYENAETDAYGEDDGAAPLLASGPASHLPGQPQLPSRTERTQLDDVSRILENHRRSFEGEGAVEARRLAGNLMVKSDGKPRWCNKCDAPKPDRAHHCSHCGVCVLRMDHHCPWLASRCVGLRNHKAFFLFLAYTSLYCAFVFEEMARALVSYVETIPDGFENSPISWAVALFIGLIFALALVPFAAYHAYLICRNRTTIESMEGSGRVRLRSTHNPSRPRVQDRLRAAVDRDASRRSGEARRSTEGGPGEGEREESGWRRDESLTKEERRALKKAAKLNIYDVGMHQNWRAVMGEQKWMWLIPLGDPSSDGLSFVVNSRTLSQLDEATAAVRTGANRRRMSSAARSSSDSEDSTLRPVRIPVSPHISSASDAPRTLGHDADYVRGPEDPSRGTGAKFRSAHGEIEWGEPPKRNFVLFGVDSDEEDGGSGGGVIGRSADDVGAEDGEQRSGASADGNVWS